MMSASVEEIQEKLDDIGPLAANIEQKTESQIGYGLPEALTASSNLDDKTVNQLLGEDE